MPDIINICAPGSLDAYDSYGHVALELGRHLARLGARVNLFAMGARETESQDAEMRQIVAQPVRPALGGIFLGYPTNYHAHANPLVHHGPRVALTMFESTMLPADWIAPLNAMDAVIVPSTFCAGVFRDSGVSAPVHVVPLGVGEAYQYQKRSGKGPLTFLAFLDRGERKGGSVALQAFLRAFGEDMRYKLVIKARGNHRPFTFTNPNIEVILEDYTEAELAALYHRCDVLIAPHKGEGFGLIPREFSATGGLALTTGWSGTADHLREWGYALPYTLETAHWRGNRILEGQDLGVWAKLDAQLVAHHLKMVAATWEWTRILLPAKAQAARDLYRWETFAQRVLHIWEGIAHARHAPREQAVRATAV